MRSKILALFLGLVISFAAYAGLESVTYISDLVATNPTATDPAHQGDDHLRAIKLGIKTTFPNINNVVQPTDEELNFVDGVTSAIQTQINTGGVNITGKAGTAKTLSTSGPSGGSDGDIWYKR